MPHTKASGKVGDAWKLGDQITVTIQQASRNHRVTLLFQHPDGMKLRAVLLQPPIVDGEITPPQILKG